MHKKIIKRIVLLIFLLIIYIYVLLIQYIPDEITIFEGENISLKTGFGITLNSEDEVLETSANTGEKTINKVGNEKLSINLFDKLFIKDIDVSVLPKTTVVPVGNIAGVKLYTNGVLVVGMSEIEGEDSKTYKPYENTGIEEGDTIVKVNENIITSTDELIEKGQVDAYQIAESENGSVIPYATTRNSARQYNRVWARDYARIYTDNTGGNSTENYNPDYSYFYGDDCANFVSQCIRYGGIGTDSVWYPYSTAWKFGGGPAGTDGGLCDYMSENDLFFRCNEESKAFAGSIICWTSYEHVGIVDQNDTVTMTFCAHTNNRLSVSFKGYSDVTFYIPCWDSVANQWTPQ